jgi:pimeloyl-ACP methyl ester carboxylesterase
MLRVRGRITIAVGAVATILLAGAAYQSYASERDRTRFPPPGVLVDAGGRRLHLLCVGAGRATVLFESGAFNNSVSYEAARAELSRFARVCSYDREGIGWSDAAPASLSVGRLAEDLAMLQDEAHLPHQLVIVTGSMGGFVTEMFARRHPDRVSGLVFLDAATSDMLPVLERLVGRRTAVTACLAAEAGGAVGLVRAADPFGFRADPDPSSVARAAALMYSSQPWKAMCALVRGIDKTDQEFSEAPPIRADVPLAVLSADATEGVLPPGVGLFISNDTIAATTRQMRQLHRQFARRSSRGSWQQVPNSAHAIANSNPELVAATVRGMLSLSPEP